MSIERGQTAMHSLTVRSKCVFFHVNSPVGSCQRGGGEVVTGSCPCRSFHPRSCQGSVSDRTCQVTTSRGEGHLRDIFFASPAALCRAWTQAPGPPGGAHCGPQGRRPSLGAVPGAPVRGARLAAHGLMAEGFRTRGKRPAAYRCSTLCFKGLLCYKEH